MAKVRAAVLAAGRGVRIGADRPKTLLPVGEHAPLLHYILDGIRRGGIDDLLVVTGFEPALVQAFVTEEWGSENASFVFNARFASWGNFHSVRMALEQSPGRDVLIVNSDIAIHPEVFERVLQSDGDLILAVQRRPDLDEEDMRVELDRTRVRQIGKHIKQVRSHGEYAGVSLIRREAARLYLDMASDLEWLAATSLYYEDLYARLIGKVEVRAASVQPGEYAEVDEPAEFEHAQQVLERHRDAWDARPASERNAQPA
ncbi:MAG: NTP transferase domain-containing protein [Actinomycetota bacterium]